MCIYFIACISYIFSESRTYELLKLWLSIYFHIIELYRLYLLRLILISFEIVTVYIIWFQFSRESKFPVLIEIIIVKYHTIELYCKNPYFGILWILFINIIIDIFIVFE